MKPRTFIKLVCAALLLVGAIGAILQVHAPYTDSWTGSAQTSDCGTVFSGNNMGDSDRQDTCDSALLTRRLWDMPALAIGLIGLAGAAWVNTGGRSGESAGSAARS
jgi:hypothetical protein